MEEKKRKKISITISKLDDKSWKIKSVVPNFESYKVSIPVVVYHNHRRAQAIKLKQLQSEQEKTPVKPEEKSESSQTNRIPTNANRNRFVRSHRRKPTNIKPAESIRHNSLVHNPNIAIGIVSLLPTDTIASILRHNNVEIPVSNLNNTNNNAPNNNKDINNNNRRDVGVSTSEPSSNTRPDNNTNNLVNVNNINKSNQTKTLNKKQDKVEETKEREVFNMETQTDNVIAVEEDDETPLDGLVPEAVPQEVPTAPTMDNTPFPSREAIEKLCQLSDWNKFLLQTNMGRTQKDWFDPNAGKKNAPVRKSVPRKRKSTTVVEYDPDLYLTRHMVASNPACMSGYASQEVPISTAPVVPPMLMAPGYNTRSSQRLEPSCQYQGMQYMPQQPVNVVPPMMYNSYPPNIHNPASCGPPMASSSQGHIPGCMSSGWQVPVESQVTMNQFLEVQRRSTTRAVRRDHMSCPHFIDDPRRRIRK